MLGRISEFSRYLVVIKLFHDKYRDTLIISKVECCGYDQTKYDDLR